MKNFAIAGVAGYIAPRHLKAIKDTGNKLIAALDPHDSVGILDSYFKEVPFFTEFERFDRFLEKEHRISEERQLDYLSICSPNHLHDAHIRLALRLKANALCEKPLVLNPHNLDALEELEQESQKKVYTILQLRVHPAILALKNKIDANKKKEKHNIDLTYITSRGPWYQYSWKGNIEKSGGVTTNIGIHFFDMLIWIFGKVESVKIERSNCGMMQGILELENAKVKWFLSIDKSYLPEEVKLSGQSTYRLIAVDGQEIEFSNGFTDLHTKVYQETLAGNGFTISDARDSIQLAYDIRNY